MNKKLYRSRTKKMVSGVCGGLEDYLGIDVTIIRLVWIIFSLVAGVFPGLVAYIIAAAIIPEEPAQNNDTWAGNPWNYQDSPYHNPYQDPSANANTPPNSDDKKPE